MDALKPIINTKKKKKKKPRCDTVLWTTGDSGQVQDETGERFDIDDDFDGERGGGGGGGIKKEKG